MAAPSYTTDLVDWIADTDVTAWSELTNMTFGGAPDEADTESALQGTNSTSQITNTTSLFSMCRILASSVTLASGNVFLVWHTHSVATALLNYASGGLRLCVATTVGDWKCWAVGGNDVAPYPYGSWINNAVDPTITGEYTLGTPPASLTFFGVGSGGILSQVVARGQPHKVDIIRYGRAEARINGGETANFAIFSGFAAANDATSARWGLIQATDGGYLWKGLMILGYTTAVDFRDSNKTIFIQDTRKVYSTFNKIEIRQATSRVDWTGINFTCLAPSTTASKGAFAMIDAADVNISACAFTDMDTFIFLSSGSVVNSTFRRTGQITTGGATFSGCTVDSNTAASAMLASSPANAAFISNTDFTSDGTGHAIEIGGTAVASMTLTGNTYTSYAASNGSTGNEAVYVNIASGVMDLVISGGGTPSVRTAGCVVTVVSGAVNVTVNVKNSASPPVAIQDARVFIKASDNTGPFPFEEAVTIVNSGTTATVTHTAHGMATNDKVVISGATIEANNGIFSITVIGAGDNTYTYTMGSSPGSSPTGAISTFVVIGAADGTGGLTDANGNISMSRVFPANQNIVGWVRKTVQPDGPFYKTGPISGTVSSASGFTANVQLISDQ